MKNIKKQTFAILLIAFFAISIFPLLSLAQAADTRVTYAYIGATPNPVGVNQETLLHIGITQQYMSLHDGWKGLTVQVTDPSGKATTLGPFNTDPTGGTGYIFVPTVEGNYTFQTFFPQQVNDVAQSGLPVGTIMLARNSSKLTLEVIQEHTAVYPGHALPTEYWSRPIDDQLHGWSVLGRQLAKNTRQPSHNRQYRCTRNSTHTMGQIPRYSEALQVQKQAITYGQQATHTRANSQARLS